ncbi:hypothetical protein [Acidiphilium sp.]|uniref:hypothetical protein n=1 Tax=Acidiphilium sp. TaxID=527 RepID=UPI00258ABD2D|nr:hypothetical protein [Acidiphilium sp.]
MTNPMTSEAASLARAASIDSAVPFYAGMAEWTAISGISRTRTYTLLATGQLRAKRVGNRTLVDVRHGLTWLAAQPDAEIGKKAAA